MKQDHHIVDPLRFYGYLGYDAEPTANDVQEALASFRDIMGIEVGVMDDRSLFDIPRCGCPDIGPGSVGTGSWPSGCHPKWPDNHAMTVNVDKRGMPSFLADVFEEAWALTAAAAAYVGMVLVRADGDARANTYVSWERGRGWIGLAIVPNRPRCSDTIWAKFDTLYGSNFERMKMIWQWAYLLSHELCHNWGFGHESTGIMSPRIISGKFTEKAWRNDYMYPKLKKAFGGDPVISEPPIWGIYPMPPGTN